MSKDSVKMLRGQVRQITKELLPEVMKHELTEQIHKELMAEIQKRLQSVEETLKRVVDNLNKQNGEIMSYLIRQHSPTMIPTASTEEQKQEIK